MMETCVIDHEFKTSFAKMLLCLIDYGLDRFVASYIALKTNSRTFEMVIIGAISFKAVQNLPPCFTMLSATLKTVPRLGYLGDTVVDRPTTATPQPAFPRAEAIDAPLFTCKELSSFLTF